MESPNPLAPSWMESVLYSLADGLVWIDTTAHVAFWNPRAEALLHWPAVEMVGRRAEEMVERVLARVVAPDAGRAQFEQALAAPEKDRTIELELMPVAVMGDTTNAVAPQDSPGNTPRFLAARFFSVLAPDGRDMGIGILFRDITRDKQSDANKSQLLSTVSHELRTPLASIKGFATTLLRQDVKWDEATQRDFLRIIEEESDRLTEIIDNLLDMSQIEAGALRIDRAPTQLRTLIREVVDEMRMRTEAHWFVVDLPSDLPPVMADSRRIRQVLHNLLENSIKYAKDGQITVTCEVEGAQMVISVSDQGEGIAPEFQDQVFDRFFQVDGRSTRRAGGSGLGLSISRGIIQAHGGKIWVESAIGRGSTFRFTLPLAPAESGE